MFRRLKKAYRDHVARQEMLVSTIRELNRTITNQSHEISIQTSAIMTLVSDLKATKVAAQKLFELESTRERRGPYGHLTNREEANGN